jgi:acetylornithine deacetylase
VSHVPFADAAALTRALVRVDSRNPDLVPGAPGEGACARLLAEVLRGWGLGVEVADAAPGRPNVVARAGRAEPGAPVLLFNGHTDVVGTEGMTHAPFDGDERGGRLYGRGAADMKGGVAAMCAAAARAHAAGALRGEVVVAAVADEEFESAGTRALVAAMAAWPRRPARASSPSPRGSR